ncbi:Telomerase reverse transcriptase isoform G [Glycine soja]|uniref:Telomerase reverse transcriptase n=1 Tax=Glycine soja TaxID=3848 RepID=A0A445GZ95_GLYSO|nr:Telomerase reverse transcriptase isoform G [Glycine soja]
MTRKRRKPAVPGVLWRMFRGRARTLSDTIISLLPPPPPPPPLVCHCRGCGCLGCTVDAEKFLLRPDDPSDYCKLLSKCFVVVSGNAPSPLPFFFPPSSRLSQHMIVGRTIEQMLLREQHSNVLCSGYDQSKCSSPIVELLSCASWCLLLSRVGDYFMFYLLRNTSIFLPAPRGKHNQVAGPPISDLCFEMLMGSSKFHHQKYGEQKRERADADDLPVKKQKCYSSYSTTCPGGFSINLDFTSESSMQVIRHHGTRDYDASVSEVPKSTRTGTVTRKLESEGEQGLNCITPRLGKRSRPFKWQRRSYKKQKQSSPEENSLNTHCNVLPTNTDSMHAGSQSNTTGLSYHAKLQMPWQCSCCLILQSLPAVPRRTEIKRQSIFYNQEYSHEVFPKKHILYSLKPNLAYSKRLIDNIFGFSNAQPISCLHSNGTCLIDSGCLYHSLVKWFKHLIRRTRYCQHTKLLNKHCVPSLDLDKNTIGRSSSRLKDNVSTTNVHKKYEEFGIKYCADTMDTTDSQSETFKSYCSKSQVVSFIWAVSRSILPSELLGTPPTWRIMRRNISKFIHLRRFEKFPLKLCMHKLKISSFPFLSNNFFLNSQSASVLKYIEGKNKFFHQEFKNWNDAVHGVKRKLLEKWIFWYFSFLVVPLVEANFYVTESEQGKQDIYYYRKSVWEKLAASTVSCFKDWRYSYLDDVAVHNILKGRPFGFSKLRLQPKENGVRMVANLEGSSRIPLLHSMGVRNCKTKGKERWKSVKKKALYADLVQHVKRNVLQFDGKFYLQGVGIPQGGVLSSLLCSMYYGHLERHVIFPFLEKTLESGSCIENNFGQTNCDDKVSSSCYLLMRFIDDFLFISTSKKQAASFFSRLERGFRGYNCYMNNKKFGANFDVEHTSDSPLNRVYVGEDGATSFLQWSGLLINCSTMEIQADYTKYLGSHLSSTLTVCWQGKPGINLKEKLRLFLRPKCHPIFCDSNINSAAVVRLNIYQVCLLCAMKFHCYIRDLSIMCKLHKRFCSNIIQRSLRYMYQMIKKQMHSISLNSDIQPILVLEKEEVEWLGFHAFVQVLKRKQSQHKELLSILRSRLSSHRISESVSPELKYAINTKNSSLLWNIKY